MGLYSLPAFAETQRQAYLAAKTALRSGDGRRFDRLIKGLQDYPLYPYLLYDSLDRRLSRAQEAEFQSFFTHYGDLPITQLLRTSWLRQLAKRRQWKRFLKYYTPQRDTVLQCYQLQARLKVARDADLLEDIKQLWLVGRSQPRQCDPVFEHLYQNKLLTRQLIWDRIRLAMDNNRPRLAQYLGQWLTPQGRKHLALWRIAHDTPERALRQLGQEDTPIMRAIVSHGIRRLARRNIAAAVRYGQPLLRRYAFQVQERQMLARLLAIRAAEQKHPLAISLMDELAPHQIDNSVFQWQLRIALSKPDWSLLRRWTQDKPAVERQAELQWQYWAARALEEAGETAQARRLYSHLATQRDYYGFIAADRIAMPYQMHHASLRPDPATLHHIAKSPAMQRIDELYQLGMHHAARREWLHMLKKLNPEQIQAIAILMARWGWYESAIMSLKRAESYNDLVLRFPIAFKERMYAQAKNLGLAPSWLFGLVRAESLLMEKARSPAGALGLMQVMPKTGRMVAGQIGLKGYRTENLLNADTNITLGSTYAKMMQEQFDGNMVLATAAYNAGPQRVVRWLAENNMCEPLDAWIEQIPFKETRNYVRRVLYFTVIYDWRLRNTPPIPQAIAARDTSRSLLQGLACPAHKASYRH